MMYSELPPPVPGDTSGRRKSARDKGSKFLRRLLHVGHMDFQFAAWQMLYLFVSPQKVYRNFQYRKQTKDQFARDDPAFLVLLALWMIASSVGLVLVLGLDVLGCIKFLLWVLCVDCVGVGVAVASLLWLISNAYLIKPTCKHSEDVEWAYAWDVHLNAFFPLLVILHVVQLFFYPVVMSEGFGGRLVGNTLCLIACAYYVYVTFLGYSALPILRKTQVLLYPLVPIGILYLVSLIAGFNLCRMLLNFYHYRVM